ncbi:MAG: putative PEP-binding protein, partial [Candidatus Altiarchaeota archaeon]
MDKLGVLGLITEKGDKTSHSLILASGRYFTVVVTRLQDVYEGDRVAILDPATTTNVVVPNGHVLHEPIKSFLDSFELSEQTPKRMIDKPPKKESIDLRTTGENPVEIKVSGTLQSLEEDAVMFLTAYSAKGSGIVRLELDMLGQEGWFKAGEARSRKRLENYVATRLTNAVRVYERESNPGDRNEDIVIRLPDISDEKFPMIFEEAYGPQACMPGGMTFLLDREEDVLIPILTGICRARKETGHSIGVMMPAITKKREADRVGQLLNEVVYPELGMKEDERIKSTVLIESPAAVDECKSIMEGQDACGIGTNDLTRFTFGLADRQGVNTLQFSPAVIGKVRAVSEEA